VADSGFILRPYQASDFEALHAMDQLCFSNAIAYTRREMRRYLAASGAHCIVGEFSGTIAGFILTQRASNVAHIITLDILEAFRRRSLGSLLLAASERRAALDGATLMYLETATTNKAAIALWGKHGYRETATIANFYGRGQNAFEMQKRLEPQS
jgi:ribosomal protein S18 acetylase RimI-like enzyme